MRPDQKTFRIGTLTQTLLHYGIHAEPSAIRFWEKEFAIKPKRSKKGHRFYTQEDIDRFIQIHDLLHTKKFTIAGAKQLLLHSDQPPRIKIPSRNEPVQNHSKNHLISTLTEIKNQLTRIKNLV